jgi:transcriptional regulator with XRE-family HTH domain
MVVLTAEEKNTLCFYLGNELSRVRKLVNLTQRELGDMCGLSRITISKLETGAVKLKWLHFMALIQIFGSYKASKEYLLKSGICHPKYLQFIQVKDDNIPPEINITLRDEIVSAITMINRDKKTEA